MRPVRPHAHPGPLGLLLPPISPPGLPSSAGTTIGDTSGATYGTTEWITRLSREAESAGAGGLWASDHLFWHRPTVECLTTLAVVATATTRVALGTCVLQHPMRSPAAVAKQASTLQVLSGGRFVLGLGVGSHAGEYEEAGADFRHRGRQLDDGIAAVRRAWDSHGDRHRPYRQEPEGGAPVWIGGSSTAARRRAATLGDGWVPLFVSPGDLADGRAMLMDEAARAGRDPGDLATAVVIVAAVGDRTAVAERDGAAWLSDLYGIPPRAFARHLVAGPAARCAERAHEYLAAGAEHVVVMIAGDHAAESFAAIATAGALVAPEPVLTGVGS
jgi:alkanesulfonate monooxygenase SsuD/methylene tetrahydromethanopterin reductase-like flavin-dependent oxidoreductase (luciferase family)